MKSKKLEKLKRNIRKLNAKELKEIDSLVDNLFLKRIEKDLQKSKDGILNA